MKHYRIKFFPLQNAFVFSPSPNFGVDPNGEFEWILNDKDKLTVSCDGNVTDIVLVFSRKSSPGNRKIPVIAVEGGDICDNKFIFSTGRQKATLQIVQVKNGAHWGFDLECKVNGVPFFVDPEMRIGTGS